MRYLRNLAVFAFVLTALAGAAAPAAVAETYNTCTGFIDSVPATITIQGIWCLRQDLDTSATSGAMIEIQANNVTIDCNGFRMRGSGGGASTMAVGIFANSRLNLAIRNCTIRGFRYGIELVGGSDYIVENNLLDQSRYTGIATSGAGSVVRRNNVVNTGGSPGNGQAYAISAAGDIIDNVVDAVFGADSQVNFNATGIDSGTDFGIVVQGNRIRNLTPKGTGTATGIHSDGSGVAVRDNAIGQASSTTGFGIVCHDNTSQVRDNVILNYVAAIDAACDNAGGNSVH